MVGAGAHDSPLSWVFAYGENSLALRLASKLADLRAAKPNQRAMLANEIYVKLF